MENSRDFRGEQPAPKDPLKFAVCLPSHRVKPKQTISTWRKSGFTYYLP